MNIFGLGGGLASLAPSWIRHYNIYPFIQQYKNANIVNRNEQDQWSLKL